MFLDIDLILNYLVATASLMTPIEVFLLRNVSLVRGLLSSWRNALADPEQMKTNLKTIGNGIGGGILERLGAAKGGATRSAQAALQEGMMENVDMGQFEGLSMLIPKKYQKSLQTLMAGYQMFQQLKGQGNVPGLPFLGGQQVPQQNGQPQ